MTSLTAREQQIMALVVAGRASKNIAAILGISQRTVENHRHNIMKKTGSASIPALVRAAINSTEDAMTTDEHRIWNEARKESIKQNQQRAAQRAFKREMFTPYLTLNEVIDREINTAIDDSMRASYHWNSTRKNI